MIMAEVGVVILNYNTYDDTVKCVESVRGYTHDVEYQIYLVDNCSPDGSGKRLSSLYEGDDRVKVICLYENGGFSAGNNAGMREAVKDGSRYLFLLNSDVYLKNDALGIMSARLKSDSGIASVGPAVYDRKGAYIQFARKALTFGTHLLERLPLLSDRIVRRYVYDPADTFVFDGMSSGCCFGLNALYFSELDDSIFMYYEEDILAHRLRKLQKKACILPEAEVVHNEGVSTKESVVGKASFEKMYRWTSAMYVLKKYAGAGKFRMGFLRWMNILEWKILSVFKKEYRDREKQFLALVEKYS